MRRRTPIILVLATASLTQAAPSQAVKPKLPPSKRYVDHERAKRVRKWHDMSTAKLAGPMRYELSVDAEHRLLRIELAAKVAKGGSLCFVMPAWAPGSYRIVNNGKRVRDLHVTVRGRDLALEHPDPNIWTVSVPEGSLRVAYALPIPRVAARRRRAKKRASSAFVLPGPATWMYETGHIDRACDVELDLPADWNVATGLNAVADPHDKGTDRKIWAFEAPDYDTLADCPIKAGVFESFGFKVGHTPFEIALSGADHDKGDRQEFAGRVRRISKYFIDMFGGAPFDRYVYQFSIPGGGGLEHLNSTTIGLMSLKGSKPGKPIIWDMVIAHEFFHAWNVKRLRPRALGPFDYTGPNRTTALWLSEGVTSYYGTVCLPRLGLWSPRDYWRHLGRKFSTLRADRRRKLMSVADSSWRVWDGSYMRSLQRIDYYLKGECLGALLDVVIRDGSRNRYSLDDVMRRLYETTRKEGFGEDDIRKTCEKYAKRDLGEFFTKYVYGTDDLPVADVMSRAGLTVTVKGSRIRLTPDGAARPLAARIRDGLVKQRRR